MLDLSIRVSRELADARAHVVVRGGLIGAGQRGVSPVARRHGSSNRHNRVQVSAAALLLNPSYLVDELALAKSHVNTTVSRLALQAHDVAVVGVVGHEETKDSQTLFGRQMMNGDRTVGEGLRQEGTDGEVFDHHQSLLPKDGHAPLAADAGRGVVSHGCVGLAHLGVQPSVVLVTRQHCARMLTRGEG